MSKEHDITIVNVEKHGNSIVHFQKPSKYYDEFSKPWH